MRLVLCAAILLQGCATTLATLDTARPTAPGHVQVALGTGVYIPAGSALRLASDGVSLARRLISDRRDPTVAELDQLFDAGLALALLPVAPVQELALRTGLSENVDAGFRLATTAARLDGKFRFLHQDDGLGTSRHASIGLGLSKFFASAGVLNALSFVQLNDFSRWDLEVPLLFTVERGDVLRLYGGAKYVLSSFSAGQQLVRAQQVAEQNGSPVLFQTRERLHFAGLVAGVMLGFRYGFLALELTGGYTVFRPTFYSYAQKGLRERRYDGVTLYPALGLVLRL